MEALQNAWKQKKKTEKRRKHKEAFTDSDLSESSSYGVPEKRERDQRHIQ